MVLQKYIEIPEENRLYIEKTFKGTKDEYIDTLKHSRTIYVSNIDENIAEERLWHLFSIVGEVRRVIMGVNRSYLTFCGFCFVEFETAKMADDAVTFFRDFILNDKALRIDKDIGFVDGRQFGRGVFGGVFKNDSKRRRMH